MASPCVVVASGGLPVTESPNGTPFTPTTNGFPVSIVANGGIPVLFVDVDGTLMPGGVGSIVVPHGTFRSQGSYSVYANNFNGSGPAGGSHDASWTIYPATFPDASVLSWRVPEGTIGGSGGVWGYSHIDFANYDQSAQQLLVEPQMVADVLNFSAAFDWSFTGSNDFSLLTEMWLTKDRDQTGGNSSGALWEIGFLLHAASSAFHDSGTLIGSTHVNNGITYTVRQHAGSQAPYITFLKSNGSDVLTAGIDWKSALAFLLLNAVITGSEWVNGVAFGAEPTFQAGTGEHSGQLTVSDYAVTFTGNTGALTADYLGTNLMTNPDSMTGWAYTAATATGGQADLNGGTSAVFVAETAASSTHEFYKDVSGDLYHAVPSRQCDLLYFEDVRVTKGRTTLNLYLANNGFSSQLTSQYDLSALTSSQGALVGTGLTTLKREIIDLGNSWRRVIIRFRKAAGITQIFTSLQITDAGTASYLGDISKGIIVRPRHRLFMEGALTISGSPSATSSQGASYSFTPTIVGGTDALAFSISAGSLPAGLSLNTSTGAITGTTTTAATYSGITLLATDARGRTSSIGPFTVTVSAATAPAFTVSPVITATHVQPQYAVQGQTYTCSTGTFSGSPTPTPSYQWRRAGSNISGATSATYVAQAADDALAIDCVVTATNTAGNASQASSNTLTGISGTLRLSEPMASQGTWSSTGGFGWSGGQMVITNSTQYNQSTKAIAGMTAAKVARCIWDQTVVDSGDAFAFCLTGATQPQGSDRNTSGTFTENLTIPASPTGIAIQTRQASCSGTIDNILVVERP